MGTQPTGASTGETARRTLDTVAAAIGLVVLSPLFVVLAVLIKRDSRGPVFHRSTRIGLEGRPFTLYKFRSMVADASSHGPGITSAGDLRVTSVGRVMRRTKLDELPQLFNVVRGDMALVGPRPEDPRYVALYSSDQRTVLGVRPGITSPASLRYRDEERLLTGDDWERRYIDRVLPAKLAIDLDYVRRRTLGSDVHLVLQTVISAVLRRQGK